MAEYCIDPTLWGQVAGKLSEATPLSSSNSRTVSTGIVCLRFKHLIAAILSKPCQHIAVTSTTQPRASPIFTNQVLILGATRDDTWLLDGRLRPKRTTSCVGCSCVTSLCKQQTCRLQHSQMAAPAGQTISVLFVPVSGWNTTTGNTKSAGGAVMFNRV
jgi:hypothetical protein